MSDKVGIIYSPGYGAGWSTWGEEDQALDQELAKAIDCGNYKEAKVIASKNWPEACLGGLGDCKVEWVDLGTTFRIDECDGYETLRLSDYIIPK